MKPSHQVHYSCFQILGMYKCVLYLTFQWTPTSTATNVEKYKANASSDLTGLPSKMASVFCKLSAFSASYSLNRESTNVCSYLKNSCLTSNITPKCKHTPP